MDGLTKELLSEVLEAEVIDYVISASTISILYKHREDYLEHQCHWNIYELMHKCKEWAIMNDISIGSVHDGLRWKSWIVGERDDFYHTTEPEAVFKACQWIIEQKEK